VARNFVAAGSQYMQNTVSAPVTAAPLTIACWGRKQDSFLNHRAVWLGNKDAASVGWILSFAWASKTVQFFAGNPSGDLIQTSTSYTNNTWTHLCAVEASATSRSVYVNGGGKVSGSISVTPAGVNAVGVARMGGTSPDGYLDGDIAEVAIWNIALTDAEVALLATGISPLMVHPEALVFYAPLLGNNDPEMDLIGGLGLTGSGGPIKAAHPRVFYLPRSQEPQHESQILAAAVLAASATLAAAGTVGDRAALAASVALSPLGKMTFAGQAALTAAVNLTALAGLDLQGRAALATVASLVAFAGQTLGGLLVLPATVALAPAATLVDLVEGLSPPAGAAIRDRPPPPGH
jgi:hypothetical protein